MTEHFDNLSGHKAEVAAAIAPALEPVISDRMQGVDCPECEDGVPHSHVAAEAVSVIQADAIEGVKVASITSDESPKKLSRLEIGKLRKLYLTRQLPTVQGCGHKIDPNGEPKLNCQTCWFAWFNSHGELVQTTDELFQEHGGEAVVQLRGRKYLKNFLAFMSTLAQWQASQKAASTAPTESSENTQNMGDAEQMDVQHPTDTGTN